MSQLARPVNLKFTDGRVCLAWNGTVLLKGTLCHRRCYFPIPNRW